MENRELLALRLAGGGLSLLFRMGRLGHGMQDTMYAH